MNYLHIVRAVTAARAPDLQPESAPCCVLPKRGPVAAVARLLTQRRSDIYAIFGENAAGKSSTLRSATAEGMLSDEEYKQGVKDKLLEPIELAWEVYEEDWLSFEEEPTYKGVPLLSDTYIPPRDFTAPKRQPGQLLPVLPRDHSTRLYAVLTYGLRPCLCLTYRTRQEIWATLTYVIDITQQGAGLPREARMQQLPDDIDLPCLRLGLELIGARVDKSEDGKELLLDAVLNLRPEQIRIPRRCWENAGKTQRIYTADVKQLDRQLEELGSAIWRMTACVREVTPAMGNVYVPFLVGALVVVPCPPLKDLLFVDYVGFIAGDQACQDAYSQLPTHAGNILACGDGRVPAVDKAFRTLNASNCQLLQKLAQPDASTPPLLLLAAAEKNLEYKKMGEDLAAQLQQALEQSDQLSLRQFCQAVPKMLSQLAAGRIVEAPAAAEAQPHGPAEQLLQHAYDLLQERQTLEARDLAMYAMNAVRRAQRVEAAAGMAGTSLARPASLAAAPAITAGSAAADDDSNHSDSESVVTDPGEDLDWSELFDLTGTPNQVADDDGSTYLTWLRLKAQHHITTLAWFPLAHQACKQLLQQHKQQLQDALYKELVTVLAGLTGFRVLQDFVNSTKAAYLERQDFAAAHAETVTANRVEQVAGPVIQRLQDGIIAALPNRPLVAERHNAAIPPLQQLLAELKGPADGHAHLGVTRLSDITAAAVEAFKEYQKPLLKHCTAERCLAEGIKSLIPLDELAEVPDLLDKLDFEGTSQSLKGPDKYGKQLVAHFRHDQSRLGALRSWLLDARTSTQEVVKTPAGCYLTPIAAPGGQQPFLQVPSSAEMQRLQLKQQQHGALAPVDTARLKLAQLCEDIQAVVRSAAEAAAEVDPALQEMLLRQCEDVPKWINESFGSCADLVRLQHNIVLPQMMLKLDCKILTSQAKRNLPTLKRLLLVQDQHKNNMAAVSEVAAEAVQAQAVASGNRLVNELETKLLNPVSIWSANSQWLQQQLQQAGGLSTVLRDITVLQCYLQARQDSNSHRASRGSSSSTESCNPALKLPQVASLLHGNVDEFISCLYHKVLPTGEQLKGAAAALHKIATLQLPAKANSSCHALLHVNTDLLDQVAAELKLSALDIPSLGRLDPSSILGLWLGALPEAVSIGELYEALCKQNTSSSNNSNSDAARVIGSDQYLKLISELLEKGLLPWDLQHIKHSISSHIRHLPPEDKVLLHQPVAALSVLQRVQLAQGLFLACNNYKKAEELFVHNQSFVDALVVPQRLLQDAESPSGQVWGGSNDGQAPAAAGFSGNVMSALESQGRVYRMEGASSSSSAVSVVRVVSKTLPFRRQGVGAKQVVRLPVLNSQHQQVGVLHLDKACEYFMCASRVYNRVKGSYAPTAAHLKVLDARPPPAVLLAALLLLRQEGGLQVEQPQRQRGQQAPAVAESADPGRLLLPMASKAASKLEAAIKELAAKRQADSSLPGQLVEHKYWEVLETKQGRPVFVYTGTLPQELAAAAAAAGCSRLPLAFNGSGAGWLQLLVFAQTGRLPSKKYLNGQNKRLLQQIGIVADTAPAAQARSSAAAGTAPRQPAAGSSAAAAAARTSRVPAAGSSAAAAAAGGNCQSNAAAGAGAAATGDSGRGAKRRASPAPAAPAAEQDQGTAATGTPATKRPRSSRSTAANPQVRIGDIVAESPVFTEDSSFTPGDVVELYVTCKKKPVDSEMRLVKLTTEGAWYPAESTNGVAPKLYLTAAALTTATDKKHNWGYRHLLMSDGRGDFVNWNNMKKDVEAARAAAAAGHEDSDSESGQ